MADVVSSFVLNYFLEYAACEENQPYKVGNSHLTVCYSFVLQCVFTIKPHEGL